MQHSLQSTYSSAFVIFLKGCRRPDSRSATIARALAKHGPDAIHSPFLNVKNSNKTAKKERPLACPFLPAAQSKKNQPSPKMEETKHHHALEWVRFANQKPHKGES